MNSDILVVDDEPDIRDLIAGVLEDEGYSVRTAATSERALEEVRARADEVRGREGEDRVLRRVGRHRVVLERVVRDVLGGRLVERHADLARRVEAHRVPVGELERRRALALEVAVLVLDGVLPDPVDVRFREEVAAPVLARLPRGAVRVAVELLVDLFVRRRAAA